MIYSKDCDQPIRLAVGGHHEKGTSVGPVSPKANRENQDALLDSKTPFSIVPPRLPDSHCFRSHGNDDSPHTPKESVFDPFAPGPEDMVLAPFCKKLVKESQNLVARRLDFDDCCDGWLGERNHNDDSVETFSEEMLLESIYGTLLEAIVLKQTEMFLVENHPSDSTEPEMPASPPRTAGITPTCPGAPIKPVARKSWNIDLRVCKKLEF
ncbi:hypothetical protein Nepgr_011908 [Nepenthes gracilis]|uniref:Uncharacterized protein n=1 Tax=Nepenthes gracilis TaxID=150966 RepID=A0AAD3SGC5_NEPGR|nr:hypothetical protein Nepgr_011908 [Nepenthes gracilis]